MTGLSGRWPRATCARKAKISSLLSLRQSCRLIPGRKKLISDQNRSNYGNFARFVMKLYRIDVKNKAKLATLRREIEATANTADRTWILEKLNEIDPK
ncbi:MAG: hypothetical protein JST83_05880 [Bacteroidetes bacterium]|nr:hypothetical protein [Bacteroidota bacterium]